LSKMVSDTSLLELDCKQCTMVWVGCNGSGMVATSSLQN
jgi:hypothetical protein